MNKLFGFKKEDCVFLDTNPTNYLVLATTRGGKSQLVAIPQIDILSKSSNNSEQSNMFISDPKGELFKYTAETLKKRGYKVLLLNIIDNEYSLSYNPIKIISDKYIEILKNNGINYNSFNFKEINEMLNFIEKDKYVDFSEVEHLIQQFTKTLIPEVGKDPFWDLSAQSLANSLIYYTLMKAVSLGDLNKFNLYNISIFMNNYLKKFDDDSEDVLYFEKLSELPAYNFARTSYPNARGQTLDSMIATLKSNLSVFASYKLGSLTSRNQFYLKELMKNNEPFAIFVITPDYDITYNKFVSMFVNQLYLEAVKEADMAQNGRLNRKMYFILDEFANVPKINDISNKLTVCLGRGIQFMLITQNIAQIKQIYGEEILQTILDNTHNKLYLLSANQQTRQFFLKQIGSTTKLIKRVNGKKLDSSSVSWEEVELPLVTDKQLEKNPLGKGYLSATKNNPLKVTLLPAYQYFNEEKLTPKEFFKKHNIKNLHNNIDVNSIVF